MKPPSETQAYYNAYSGHYDAERLSPYYEMLRRIELDVILPLATGRRVLEVGCGTGQVLELVKAVARDVRGVDLSPGMLAQARAKGLAVSCHNAERLGLPDASFEMVYSLKALPHVPNVTAALDEIRRVLVPGGSAVLEFYNARSLKALSARVRRADEQVFCHVHRFDEIRSQLAERFSIVEVRGARVVTPFAGAVALPGVGRLLKRAELTLSRGAAARFAGYLLFVLRKH